MQPQRLLMISIDRSLFTEGSDVRARMIEYGKRWDEVHIIVAAGRNFREQHLGNNVWIYPSRYFWKITYPLGIIRLGRFIISHRKITQITCQDPFLTAMAGISLKKQSALPLEIQVHTDIGSPYFATTFGNKIRKSLALSYLKRADSIRVVSERIKRYITDSLGIDGGLITVRPIAVDMEKIKTASISADLHKKYPQFEKIILMASRLEPEKDIGSAVKAFGEVVKRIPKAGLVIVGGGSQAVKLKRQVADLGLTVSVKFEPPADFQTLVSYYKTTDLFLLTSLYEGYGLTLVEAKAVGARIVSTDVGVAREEGATIVGHDEREIADAIIRELT